MIYLIENKNLNFINQKLFPRLFFASQFWDHAYYSFVFYITKETNNGSGHHFFKLESS